MSKSWLQFVQLYSEKNSHLNEEEVLKQAKRPYQQLKKLFAKQRGGDTNNIELRDPQMRFEAGVSALNSNLKDIGRSVIFGGDTNNIELRDPQMRFEAGVSALNSNLKEIGRSVIFGGKKKMTGGSNCPTCGLSGNCRYSKMERVYKCICPKGHSWTE
jgi:hypothetical protein